MVNVDWEALRSAAVTARGKAYAPYSGFAVGAAALVDSGVVVSGCNVENASSGLTLCAECSLVSDLFASGGGRLIAFVCVSESGLLMPCGRCRQLLFEHGGAECLVLSDNGVLTVGSLLPMPFSRDDIV